MTSFFPVKIYSIKIFIFVWLWVPHATTSFLVTFTTSPLYKNAFPLSRSDADAIKDEKLATYSDPSEDPKVTDPTATHTYLADLKGRISHDLEALYEELDRRDTYYRSGGR